MMKKIISIILLLAILTLTSCEKNIYPKGFTGGIGIKRGSGRQVAWVETADDLYTSAYLLKNHESSFIGGYFFDFDSFFDIKYCFVFDYGKDKIEYGDSHFDRWAENVEIRSYCFLDDVTIDALNYSDINNYEHLTITFTDAYLEKYSGEFIDTFLFQYNWDDEFEKYFAFYEGEKIFSIDFISRFNVIPPDDVFNGIINNLVYIGED